jgi:hemerythrin-like domain-containing protein/uncharacterized protein (DUF2249 family)
MDTICSYLEDDHSRCDALFVETVGCVAQRNWEPAERAFQAFERALQLHLAMEEDVIFSAFELVVSGEPAPTHGLRQEHRQMRGLLHRLSGAIEQRHVVDFFDHADTFRIVLQQHSMKEEGLLYPMADRMLSRKRAELIRAMVAMREAEAELARAGAAGRELDVRGLEPAEQMERVLLALGKLGRGNALCALLDREPYPLYRLLDQNGYSHTTRARSEAAFALRVWVGDPLEPPA